ncbi:hypothetical protein BK721_12955 [Bacillus thuringiensis serovar nigeriensis]|uniref:hypothetical protein n=1 Tax=Bacillus thuringiensis TaxID=1428 RepID=UPI000A3A74D5|nr:hypothetical protein [Bacillus thuringiensis]MEC3429856.1 hypothetical protein [Bacillus cereus]MRC95623.1 hypothetical protein [Bacillus thuringiensis]OTX20460.1 hypothetical protein BK721_12955 [Bacillus thuringiensis serovar nigeriensis]
METKFEHNVKLDNHIITKLLEQNDKRALFIYTYALRWNIERLCVPTPISFILELLRKKPVATNIKSVRNSLKVLIEMKLIKVYSEITLKNEADIDSLNKNDFMYIVAEESLSEENYTLLKAEYIDMTMINELELEKEDMMATVLLLSRNIERRDEVLQVCWHSTDKLTKELKIRKARVFELIDGLKKLEVIYYEKLSFDLSNGKKREHYVYSMFEDKEQVGAAIQTATRNGVLDGRAKGIKPADEDMVSNEVIISHVDEDGLVDYAVDMEVNNKLELMGIVLNTNSVKRINEVKEQYGYRILLEALTDISYSIQGIDNPTGYMMKMLPIKAKEYKYKVF